MKKILLSALLAIATSVAFSTIRTVSNQTPNPGQFTTIQAAINASSPGDSVYIHPSQIAYAAFSLDRKLTIIGSGFQPSMLNPHPLATIDGGTINISNVNASFSNLIGLYLTNCSIDMVAGMHDILITRCWFNVAGIIFRANTYNITIAENIFIESGLMLTGAAGTAHDFLITNNVFRHSYECCGARRNFQDWNGVMNTNVINNLFYSGGFFGNSGKDNRIAGNSSGLTFSNNIFNRVEFGELTNSTFSNCITYSCVGNTPWINNGTDLGVPALGTQNIANTAPDFVNAANVNAGGYGVNSYTVNPSSPTLSSMPGDADMGPYGGNGAYNFNRSSASNLPYVYSIVIGNPAIQSGSDLNIDVVGKKHD